MSEILARPAGGVTALLDRMAAGDAASAETVYPLVYAELRRIAGAHLRREREGHTLAATDLVHEAYVRLVGAPGTWADRAHFYAVASSAMRRVLVDWARARRTAKRGGGAARVTLADAALAAPERPETVLALDEALVALARRSERQARVVECRYFGGLSIEETAAALGVSPTTVQADWRLARAWLAAFMGGDLADGPSDPGRSDAP